MTESKIHWLVDTREHEQWTTIDLHDYDMEAALYVDEDTKTVKAYFDTHGEEREWQLIPLALSLGYTWDIIQEPILHLN